MSEQSTETLNLARRAASAAIASFDAASAALTLHPDYEEVLNAYRAAAAAAALTCQLFGVVVSLAYSADLPSD